ncbi:MAG: phosphatase PAP2 family protein [Candidatus Hodarchaeales archaeon]
MDILLGALAIEIIKALQGLNDILPFLDIFFIIVTNLGLDLVYIAIIAVSYWLFSKKIGLRLAVLIVLTSYLTNIVKGIFGVLRPYESTTAVRKLADETSYSFFSGHSSSSGAFWGHLSLIIRKKVFVGISILIILLIPLSRVYLAVHWPSDVIAGSIFGLLAGFIMYKYIDSITPYFADKDDKSKILIVTITSLSLAIIAVIIPVLTGVDQIRAVNTSMPGAFAGFLIGAIIEKRITDFDNIDFASGNWKVKALLRVVVGLVILLSIYVILKLLFGPFENDLTLLLITDYLRYFILGLTGSFICPFIFVKLKT